MAAGEEPRGDGADLKRGGSSRSGYVTFAVKQHTLQMLLAEADRALRRCGLALHGRRFDSGDEAAGLVIEPDQGAQDPRTAIREIVDALLSGLVLRLDSLSATFGRLSEQERISVAALLRLSEQERMTIATLLRLPELERVELSLGLRLSDNECGALAELLEPRKGVDEAARPLIAIVDPTAEAGEHTREQVASDHIPTMQPESPST
jgi:hypothetical protein